MKVPVPFEYIWPAGVLCLGVEPATDFDKRGQADDQARDKDTGERIWLVRVLDLDPEAGRFGGSKEVKVKVASAVAPVMPGVDDSRCKESGRCRARQAWSIRATGMSEPKPASASGRSAA